MNARTPTTSSGKGCRGQTTEEYPFRPSCVYADYSEERYLKFALGDRGVGVGVVGPGSGDNCFFACYRVENFQCHITEIVPFTTNPWCRTLNN